MSTNQRRINAENNAERKRRERERSRGEGWSYVTVRCPPLVGDEIRELAATRREEFLRGDVS